MMGIAEAVKARANCRGSRIGALLVLEGRIVSTGYNGTPSDMTNCDEGGCERCANPERYESGTAYDICICVHAEQNALLAAARFGIAVEGAILYSTMRPCFGCTKELLQARVKGVVYLEDWRHPNRELRSEYEKTTGPLPRWSKGTTQPNGTETAVPERSAGSRLPGDAGNHPSSPTPIGVPAGYGNRAVFTCTP